METITKPRVIIEAVVTRADGRIENLGIVADSKDEKVSMIKKIFNLIGRRK